MAITSCFPCSHPLYGGHYHASSTGLMVNPFTMEVMPDQWCTKYGLTRPTPERKVTRMSQALWCDSGDHAFSANDEDAESYTRTKKVKRTGYDGRSYQDEVTLQYDVCGKHVASQFQEASQKAIQNETGAQVSDGS